MENSVFGVLISICLRGKISPTGWDWVLVRLGLC